MSPKHTYKAPLVVYITIICLFALVLLLHPHTSMANSPLLLNELKIDPPGDDGPFEYIELKGTPNSMVSSGTYVVAFDGNRPQAGVATMVVSLGGLTLGSNGLVVIHSSVGGHAFPADTVHVADPQLIVGGLPNDAGSLLLISSFVVPVFEGIDYDSDDDGLLELPTAAIVRDAVAWRNPASDGLVYGGVVLTQPEGASDAATRFFNNAVPLSNEAWYRGDLLGATSDSTAYDLTNVSDNFPADGELTPGIANQPDELSPCAFNSLTPIPSIQGNGPNSPRLGDQVTIQGIATGDFQGAEALEGFFVQAPAGDGDPSTSDGIFVFVPPANLLSSIDVQVGELVRVTGVVREANMRTEIDFVSTLDVCEESTPIEPVIVELPLDTPEDFERYESMLITMPEPLTVSDNAWLGHYGQVTLSAAGRMYTPTSDQQNLPDSNTRRFVLDDGSKTEFPNPIPYIGAENTLRSGDIATGIIGIFDQGQVGLAPFNINYRLHPTAAPTFTRTNPRSTAPVPVGGNVTVASWNVGHYFTTIDDGTNGALGADSAEEFQRQRTKLITALDRINAGVVGLVGIENNNTLALDDLVRGLNETRGTNTYAAITSPPLVGTAPTQVALLYQPAVVTPIGPAQRSHNPLFTHPPLAQSFRVNSNDATFTVVVNHFHPRTNCPSSDDDPNADTGQGCWNLLRTQQASTLNEFTKELMSSSNMLLLGDFNAYSRETPLHVLETNGFVNQIAQQLPLVERYTSVVAGQAGYLAHVLTNASLSSQVSGVTIWHINADEPAVLDYNTEDKVQDLYTPTPYRSSPHDPVIVGLDLNKQSERVYLPFLNW
ncbi:MAG: ExeM/NucH family extracellular endonuclease [Chloroflexi bacterium AL-N10]|nr:ExeM/NucH family extracellular endonuclease [Chloroflexi bacterium AL-N10]